MGVNLPGRLWGDPRPGGCMYANIHVGVQRRAEVVDMFPGDAGEAVWDFPVDLSTKDGDVDFRGPFVHGRSGDRFVYLGWGTLGESGAFDMFRRAKLMLGAIEGAVIEAALQPGHRLLGTLGLTGGDGGPRCAAVRPPAVSWTGVAVG